MNCLGVVDVDMSSVDERLVLMLECVMIPSSSELWMLWSSVVSSVVFGLTVESIGEAGPAGSCFGTCCFELPVVSVVGSCRSLL